MHFESVALLAAPARTPPPLPHWPLPCCPAPAAGTVEQFAAERGQMVLRKATDGTVELTPEDLLGPSLVAEAEAAATGGSGGGEGGAASGAAS